MKHSGFTMIEVVFIIVILGIWAAVALPKSAASNTPQTSSISNY